MHRQNDWKNIRWSLAVLALGGVLFGCAGNTVGGGGGTTSTTSTTGGLFSDVAGVNLPDTPALLEYGFLTGAGRAGDEKIALARNLIVQDIFGTEASGLTEKTLTLTQYQSQLLSTNTDLKGQQSRLFNTLQLNIKNYKQTEAGNTQSFSSINNIPNDLPAALRVFKGRHTIVPMYLDPDTFTTEVVNIGGTDFTQAKFDADWFNTINKIDGDTVAVRSYLSDYVCFDVAAMSPGDLPSLSNANGTANRIFFSGDGFAIGSGSTSSLNSQGGAPFELILQDGQGASVVGRHSTFGNSILAPGTYTTLNIDPSDVTTTDPVLARKITSFQGTWKYHFNQRINLQTNKVEDDGYLKNVHPFEAVSIPTSLDDERQQVIMFAESVTTNGNGTKTATITNMMWGYLDLATKKVFIYPLTNLTDPDAQTNRVGEIAGTLGTMYTASGATTLSPQQMRFVQFNLDSTPAGFASTGKIVVIRR